MNKHDSQNVPENEQPRNAIDSANEKERKAAKLLAQVAEAVRAFQVKTTGHKPTAVSVVLSEDTLVITVHGALSPAERVLANTAEGAAKVQEFHRQLFTANSLTLRQEIKRIIGRDVHDAIATIEPVSGTIVQAFSTGTMVQVFLLKSEEREPDASGGMPDRQDVSE